MSKLAHAGSFRELVVYQKSRELSREIFRMTRAFPRAEMFSLTDQVRRSSRSIGAQIAEAWAKRRYERHFISKLTDADGEQLETQHWLGIAFDCEYIGKETGGELNERCKEIGRMLAGMIEKADLFCGEPPRSLSEESAAYFAGTDN